MFNSLLLDIGPKSELLLANTGHKSAAYITTLRELKPNKASLLSDTLANSSFTYYLTSDNLDKPIIDDLETYITRSRYSLDVF